MVTSLTKQYQAFIATPQLSIEGKQDYKQFETQVGSIPEKLEIQEYVFGKRMEEFLAIYLENQPRYKVLAKGLQVIEHKTTLGELDFIIKDRFTQQYIHIELVSKLYVYDPSIPKEIDRWIGPNRKDSLVQKLEKLETKQFPLLHHTRTQEVLLNMEIPINTIEQQLCFKAQLFLPYRYDTKMLSTAYHPAVGGYWLHLAQLSPPEFQAYTFYLPSKMDWYCTPQPKVMWRSLAEAQPQIAEHHERQKSPLVWINKGNHIFEKCFVVWW